MARTQKLTDQSVRRLSTPIDREVEYADALVPGLYVVVWPSGVKAWCLRYRITETARGGTRTRRTRRMVFERFPGMNVAAARKAARALLERVEEGVDPAEERRQGRSTAALEPITNSYPDVARRFVKLHGQARLRSWQEQARFLGLKPNPRPPFEKQLVTIPGGLAERWANRELASIGRAEIVKVLDDIVEAGRGTTANRTRAALSKFSTGQQTAAPTA